MSTSSSPPLKRFKRELGKNEQEEEVEVDDEPHCTICLESFIDRAILPSCAHEFCFECILVWAEQSRKCPLCSRSFDAYVIHHVRSQYDYQKHYLPPARVPSPPPSAHTAESRANALRNTRRERQWGRRQRHAREEADQLERAIARRRWIYQHDLYAKHVASNPYTRYRPFPTPAQFSSSPDLISRMTSFLRRELRVWPHLDVEFLTTYTISLMKSIDIRSESAVKLLSEFLDLDTQYARGHAEHFAHEIYSYLRSPYRDLYTYDQIAQYDVPSEISPPQEIERSRRWSPSPCHRSAESHREYRVRRSPRNVPPCREDDDPRNQPASVGPCGDQIIDGLRSVDPDPEVSDESGHAELPLEPRHDDGGDDDECKGRDASTSTLRGNGGHIDGPLEGGDDAADYVDNIGEGSSANPPTSRKRLAASGSRVHPRNRTLSASVHAHLARPSGSARKPATTPRDERSAGPKSALAKDDDTPPDVDCRHTITTGNTGRPNSDGKLRAVGRQSETSSDETSRQCVSLHSDFSSAADPAVAASVESDRDDGSVWTKTGTGTGSADRIPGFPPVSGGTGTVTDVTRGLVPRHHGVAMTRESSVAVDMTDPGMRTGEDEAAAVGGTVEPVDKRCTSTPARMAGTGTRAGTVDAGRDGDGGCGESGRDGDGDVDVDHGLDVTQDADTKALETRLRARARVRVRLAAMKAGGVMLNGTASALASSASRSGLGELISGARADVVDGKDDQGMVDAVEEGRGREVEREVVLRGELMRRAPIR